MKKAPICLLIVAILVIYVPNVATASTGKYSTDVCSGRIKDVRGQLKIHFYVALSDTKSNTAVGVSNCSVAAGKTAFLDGRLIGGKARIIHTDYTKDVVANMRLSRDGKTWTSILITATSCKEDKDPRFFMASIYQKSVAVGYYRATCDCTNGPNNHLTPYCGILRSDGPDVDAGKPHVRQT